MRGASAHPGLAFAKGRRQATARTAKRATRREWIRFVHGEVFSRRPACQLCHTTRGRHEMHECVSRAQLRGRPLEVIFNLWNCARLCRDCHVAITERRGDVAMMDRALGCEGPLHYQLRLARHLAPPPDRLGDPPQAAVDAILRLWAAR